MNAKQHHEFVNNRAPARDIFEANRQMADLDKLERARGGRTLVRPSGGGQAFTAVNVYGRVDSDSPTSSFGGVGFTPVARKIVYPSGGGTDYEQEGFVVFPGPVTATYLAFIGSNPVNLAHNAVTTELDAYSNGAGVGSYIWRAFFRVYGVTSWGGHGTLPTDPSPINWNNKGDIVLTDSTFCGSVRAVANAYDPSATLVQDNPTHSINALAVQGATRTTLLGLWIKIDSVVAPGFPAPTSGDYYSAKLSINPTGSPGIIAA